MSHLWRQHPKNRKNDHIKKLEYFSHQLRKKIVKIVEALERQKTVRVPDPLNEGQFIEKEEDDPDFVEAKLHSDRIASTAEMR